MASDSTVARASVDLRKSGSALGGSVLARRRWDALSPAERAKAAKRASVAARKARKRNPKKASRQAAKNAAAISPEAAKARGLKIAAAISPEVAKARSLKAWATRRKNTRAAGRAARKKKLAAG